jgi:hypothetical protein
MYVCAICVKDAVTRMATLDLSHRPAMRCALCGEQSPVVSLGHPNTVNVCMVCVTSMNQMVDEYAHRYLSEA